MWKDQPWKLREMNDRLMMAERALTDREGISGRPWYKHLVYFYSPLQIFVSFCCINITKINATHYVTIICMPSKCNTLSNKRHYLTQVITSVIHTFLVCCCIPSKCNTLSNNNFVCIRFMHRQSTMITDLNASREQMTPLKMQRASILKIHGFRYNMKFGESPGQSPRHHQFSVVN